MQRLNFSALLLAIFVSSAAFAAEPKVAPSPNDTTTPVKRADCAGCQDRGVYSPPPCSCIQQLWMDYPGANDLYISLTMFETCDEGEEELWYGAPGNIARPQDCESNQCEVYEGRRGVQRALPGHGHPLAGARAWDVIRMGLESAKQKTPKLEYGTPLYHKIPQINIPEGLATTSDMLVMAVPINVHVKDSPLDGKTYYLCVQIDSAEGLPTTAATFEDGELGSGSQLKIVYHVNGDVRTGLVWLK